MADDFLSSIGSGLSSLGTGLGNVLSNPLAQAALGTYFGAIGTPRWEGLGGAISRGGLAGLGTFAQARQAQFQQPILQQAAQQARAEMQPLSKEENDQLNSLKASMVMVDPLTNKTIPDPQGTQYIGLLESQRRAGRLSTKDFVDALGHFDESKRMSNMMTAQSKLMMASMYPALAKQFGLNIGPIGVMPGTAPQPSEPAAPPAQPQSMAPSGKASPTQYTPQIMANLKTWARQARQMPDGSYTFLGDDNQWHQMTPVGMQGPPIQP